MSWLDVELRILLFGHRSWTLLSHTKARHQRQGQQGLQLNFGRNRSYHLSEQPGRLLPLWPPPVPAEEGHLVPHCFTKRLFRDSSPRCKATTAKAACAAVCAEALLETELWAFASPGQDGTVGLKVLGCLTAPYAAPRGWARTNLHQYTGFPCPKPHA